MESTYIVTAKLDPSAQDEKILNDRLYAAYRMQRKLTHHAVTSLHALKQDGTYRDLLLLYRESKAPSMKKFVGQALNEMQRRYGLSSGQFESWMKKQQHRYRKLVNSHVAQKLAASVWQAASKCLYSDGKQIHQKQYMDFVSIEGKNNSTGIVFRDDRIRIGKQEIPLKDHRKDAYLNEALTHRVKYCRLLRKPMGNRWHWYVQIVLEGIPPQKHAFREDGRVGLDQGISTEAIVAEDGCFLACLGPGDRYDAPAKECQQKMDRSLRQNNPEEYHADGTVKKKKHWWKYSRHYRKEQLKLKTIRRKASDTAKQKEHMLCNIILERYGSDIFTEKMDYKALARRAQSEEEELSRGKKKRFGASIGKNAPGRFIETLKQKLGYIGKTITVVDLYGFKASQYDHVKDAYEKHDLDERWKDIGGMLVQRDLYSGFLLRNAEEPTEEGPPKKPDRQKCMEGFTSFLKDQYECITDMLEENVSNKAVFGF